MTAVEANFDGLVGNTHNYAGLSIGNIASVSSSGSTSNPRQAALQGLDKMKTLADMGIAQGVLPPHERPNVHELRRRGYRGTDGAVLSRVQREDPRLLAAVSSASAMWAANAATVSPSADTADGRVHLTPANLAGNRHRAIETPTTTALLRTIFSDASRFTVHDPLPDELGDEGAANHTRLAPDHGAPGVELFVYGSGGSLESRRHPGRQSFAASRTVATRHAVHRYVMAQQRPDSVDAGVFHNDVIAVGNLTTLFLHESAFLDQRAVLAALDDLFENELTVIEVPAGLVSVEDAVATYLFNSQLISIGARQILVAPAEIHEIPAVDEFVRSLPSAEGPIRDVITMDLRQSMRNGGGPACLRLRVVLTPDERASVHAPVWLTDELYTELVAWIDRHYRSELTAADLADPALLTENRRSLDELTQLLRLGTIYEFQR